MAEFDTHAANYREQVDRGVRWSGDGVDYFAQYKARYLARLVGADYAGKILDYGCGIGAVSACLADELPRATLHGFDVSSASVARIPDGLRQRGRFTSDSAELDDDYDLILVANVLHHVVPGDRPSFAESIAAALRSGGRALVFEHNPLNPLTRRVVASCPLDEDAVLLGSRETRRLLADAGFADVRREYVVFFPRPLARLRRLERFLSWLPLGAQYAVVGRKP